MKFSKIIFAAVLLVVGLTVTPSANAAAARNRNTGHKSFNLAETENIKSTKLGVLQGSLVINSTDNKTNTGGNEVEENTTGDNSVKTGKARTRVSNDTTANVSRVKITQDSPVSGSAGNKNTGAESVNIAEVENSQKVGVGVVQIGVVINHTETMANTGNNEVEENTKGGSVTTGNAITVVENTNMVNCSSVVINQ